MGAADRRGEGEAEPGDAEIVRLLRLASQTAIPEPSPDLIGRIVARVRNRILAGDLLRLVTLHGVWSRAERGPGAKRRD